MLVMDWHQGSTLLSDVILDVVLHEGKLKGLGNRRLWCLKQHAADKKEDMCVCLCVCVNTSAVEQEIAPQNRNILLIDRPWLVSWFGWLVG